MAREVPITQKQVPINARVQVTGGPQGPANLSRDVASVLRQNRDNYQAQAIENAYLRGTVNLTEQMSALEKQYQNDPDGLQTAIDDYKEGFLSEVNDPEMLARFELQMQTAGEAAIARATKARNALIDDQAMFDNQTAYQAIQDNIGSVVKSMASPDLGERTAAARQLQELQNRGATILTATKADGTPMFSPEYRAEQLYNLKEKSLLDYMDAYFQNAPDKEAALKEFENGNIFIQLPNAGESTAKTGNRLMTDLQNELGISKEVAAGIVGNLAYESGGFMQLQEIAPMIPGSRGGFGFAQWTGPRREAFERWSAEQGLDPKSYEANKGFLIHELKNTPEGAVLNDLKGAKDQLEAAKVFSDKFLRPGIKNMGSRLAWAQALFNGQDGVDLVNVTDSVGQKTRDLIKKTGADYIEHAKKAVIAAQQASVFEQVQRENVLHEELQNPDLPINEKIALINKLDFTGDIRDDYAVEARRYMQSLGDLNAATNSDRMADIVTRMYDINANDESDSDYLIGIRNIRDEIMKARADGDLSADDEAKLNNQMKTLTSARTAEATNQVSYMFGNARELIQNGLPPELRGDATRQLFYAAQELQAQAQDPEKEPITVKEYRVKALEIIDAIKEQRRTGAIQKMQDLKAGNVVKQNGLNAGDIVKGYRFNGGDPADQKNWEKV